MTRTNCKHLTTTIALATVATTLGLALGAPAAAGTTRNDPSICATTSDAEGLQEFFGSDRAPLRADYQRTITLPGGRVLWTFQDAFVPVDGGGTTLIHSAGLVQTGNCFQLLRSGTGASPSAWLLPEQTVRFHHWFWPLAGTVAADGDVRIFVVEMEERGSHYLDHVVPIATWIVRLRTSDLQVLDARLAPDPTPSLFGWSITSDSRWTYLYAHCYRQFGYDLFPMTNPPVYTHDLDCTDEVRVARVPLGHLDAAPTYWDGTAWTHDAGRAIPVIPTTGRTINPAQVQYLDGTFVAVTKVGDWFGDTIYIDTATTAHGPFTTARTIHTDSLCGKDCNTYFASVIAAPGAPGTLMIGLSNNRWDGHESSAYRPTFETIDLPPVPQAAPPSPRTR